MTRLIHLPAIQNLCQYDKSSAFHNYRYDRHYTIMISLLYTVFFTVRSAFGIVARFVVQEIVALDFPQYQPWLLQE